MQCLIFLPGCLAVPGPRVGLEAHTAPPAVLPPTSPTPPTAPAFPPPTSPTPPTAPAAWALPCASTFRHFSFISQYTSVQDMKQIRGEMSEIFWNQETFQIQ